MQLFKSLLYPTASLTLSLSRHPFASLFIFVNRKTLLHPQQHYARLQH